LIDADFLVMLGSLFIGLACRFIAFRARAGRGNVDGRTIAQGTITEIALASEPAMRRRRSFLPLPLAKVR
jgi:hypothetical protein